MKNQFIFRSAILFVACLLGSHVSFSQSWNGVKGSGNVTEQNRNLSGFTAIEVSHGLDLYLTQGADEVRVKADDNLQDMIIAEVKGNTLKLYVKKGGIRKSTAMDVYVSVNDLQHLSASGGSDVSSKGTFQLDKLKLNASGGSDVTLDIEAKELYCDVSGGSDTDLSGSVNSIWVQASGGSDLRAKNLKANKGDINASGAADVNVYVTGEISVDASGASDVYHSGGAKIISQRASGGADISGN